MSKLKVVRVLIILLITATIAILCFAWAGKEDKKSAKTPQYTYVLLEEAGTSRLHRTTQTIKVSDAYCVLEAECCSTMIRFSMINAYVYSNKPYYLSFYVDICGGDW